MAGGVDEVDGVAPLVRLPDEYVLVVESLSGASAEIVEFGKRYWALKEIDTTSSQPRARWHEPTKQLASESGFAASRFYILAAAGVRAIVDGLECPRCRQPYSLRARGGLDALLAGRSPEHCVDCDANVAEAVRREVTPDADRQRRAAREASRRRDTVAAAKRDWQTAQQEYVRERNALQLTPGSEPPGDATVRTEVAALAMLRHAPTVTPLPPINSWPCPFAPTADMSAELAADCYHARLLAIHPDSELAAFLWAPTFDEAVSAADGDFSSMPRPEWKSFYPSHTSWYVPYGPSLGTAAENLDQYLSDRLDLDGLDGGRAEELIGLVVELIASETLRYFAFQLEYHHLPEVPENHLPRLVSAVTRLANERSLAETYNVAWNAARQAAATAQATPQAPKANMTTHAVNVFETKAQQFASDPDVPLKPYSETSRVPLSALARTLFITVLNADMMTTTRADVETILKTRLPSDEPSDNDRVIVEAMRAVLATETEGDPHQVYAALGRESANSDPLIATAADRLIDVVERFRMVGYDPAGALAGAVNSAGMLFSLANVPDVWSGEPGTVRREVGSYLAEVMRQAAVRSSAV